MAPRAVAGASAVVVAVPRLLAIALTTIVATTGGEAKAQGTDAWSGARVMARVSETKLKVGETVSARLNAGSVFRVDRVNGDWLWVDSGNIRGWVKKADVVAFDQAIPYFSEVIRAEPENAFAFVSRTYC